MAGRRRDPGTVIAKRRKRQTQPRAATVTKFDRDGRVIAVQALISEGVPEVEIVRWLTTEITDADVKLGAERGITLVAKPWKVSEPTARDYIRTAYQLWSAQDVRDTTAKRHKMQARQRALLVFRRAVAAGDLKVALTANDQIAKMDGAYDPAPAIPEAEGEAIDQAEAVSLIEHAAGLVELGRRRGVITAAQAAAAIDVPPDAATPTIEPPPAPVPAPPAPSTGTN